MPTAIQLHSIVNYGTVNPSAYTEFNTGCVASCTVLTCSCTRPFEYWSSTTDQYNPLYAVDVSFTYGEVFEDEAKSGGNNVRAVRGGP